MIGTAAVRKSQYPRQVTGQPQAADSCRPQSSQSLVFVAKIKQPALQGQGESEEVYVSDIIYHKVQRTRRPSPMFSEKSFTEFSKAP